MIRLCQECVDNASLLRSDCVFGRTVNGQCHMVLKTLREIKPYEEITYDYNFDSFNMEAQVSKKKKAGFTEKGRGLFFHKQCFQTLALCVDFSLLDVGLTGIVRIVIYEVFCFCF